MKWEYQTRWLRLLIELFPAPPQIRRYRVTAARFEVQTARLLRRQITRQMRRMGAEETP